MKIKLGYYDINGIYIPDQPKCNEYFLMMGEFRKKIAEHEHQSPYKYNRVDRYTKTYCDENRIYVYAIYFKDGKIVETQRTVPYYYYGNKGRYEIFKKICTHIKLTKSPELMQKYNITDERRIYYPVYV